MNQNAKVSKNSMGKIFVIIIAFILGGTGLSILFNTSGQTIEIIGGFTLIGMAVAIIYKLMEDG